MNRIYRSESDELATSCGFAEMPGWNIALQQQELLKNVAGILPIVWPITNYSADDGLPPAGNIVSINE